MIRRALDNTVEGILLVMMVLLCADVFLGVFSRYVMGRTFTWYDEIARLLFVWIVFLGAAVGVKRAAHFRLHLVIDRFPASPLVPIAQERVKGLAGQQALGPADKTVLSPGDYACTIDGLYPNKAGWCGRVRQMRYPYYLMEISDLRMNAWYALWLGRSTCTGDRLLSWFSQGDQIWVPRTCLAEPRTTG